MITASQGDILGGNVGVRIYQDYFQWTEFKDPSRQVDENVCKKSDLDKKKAEALALYNDTTVWVTTEPDRQPGTDVEVRLRGGRRQPPAA